MNSLMDHSKNVETYEIDLFKERERVEENRHLKDGLARRRAAMNTRFHSGSYDKLGKACTRVDSGDPPEKIDDLSTTKEPVTSLIVNEFDWETFKKKMQNDRSTTRTPRVRQKSTTSVGRRNNIFFSSSPSLDDSSLNDDQEDDLEKRTRSMTIG